MDAERVADYYVQYNGHDVQHLQKVHDALRVHCNKLIFFAGDSSLDNKAWVDTSMKAINGYENVLHPAMMKQDVCYWVNRMCEDRNIPDVACLNTSVEATTLSHRSWDLLDQDAFIRDHIRADDYLVVSVGGNDIALNPLLCTVCNILPLVLCTPIACLRSCACACPPNLHCDLGCWGCGLPGCISGTCGCPPGLGYFVDLFGNRVENYVRHLVAKSKPKKVVICMIYYPDEKVTGGWADLPLKVLGYNRSPGRLQLAIATIFRLATQRISIPGVEVVALPLFEVLNGKDTGDYVARVEPSVVGGQKMATAIVDRLFGPNLMAMM